MNGRYILDTNAVIALLSGNADLAALLSKADWVAIPVIVELEFLAFPNLSNADKALFEQFKKRIAVISLDATNDSLLKTIVHIRQTFNAKLPDAIIAANTIEETATLISNDKDFKRITELSLASF